MQATLGSLAIPLLLLCSQSNLQKIRHFSIKQASLNIMRNLFCVFFLKYVCSFATNIGLLKEGKTLLYHVNIHFKDSSKFALKR